MSQASIRQYKEDEHLLEAEVDQQAVSNTEIEKVASKNENPAEDKQDEPYYHYTVDTNEPDPWLIKHKTKIIVLVILAGIGLTGDFFYKEMKLKEQSIAIVAAPEVNDLYYVDFRVIKDNLRPSEKFRMAKVKDITGDVVTINFSSYFYLQEHFKLALDDPGIAIPYPQINVYLNKVND